MATALQIFSAAATVEGPLEGETGHGLLHLPGPGVFAIAAGADGRPSDSFSVRILTKALRIAFRPKDGEAGPQSLAEKSRLIRDAIRAAGEAILSQPAEKRSGGASVAVLAFDEADPARACLINVGDCRCYRFRNSRPERLTRAVSSAEAAAETPLLLDVLSNAVGRDEHLEIEEQALDVQAGDSFALLPGSLFRVKPDQAVGRALRRVPNKDVQLMASSLVEEALKTESAAGVALVVRTDAAPPPAAKAVEAPADVTVPPEAAPAAAAPPARDDARPETEEEAREREISEGGPLAPGGVAPAPPPEAPAETPPEESAAGMPPPAPQPPAPPAEEERPEPKPPVSREAKLEQLARQAPAKVPKAAAAPAKPAGPKPAPARPASPLSRSPLLATNGEPQKPFPTALVATLAAAVIALAGVIWLGVHFWGRLRSSSDGEAELQRGATVAAVIAEAKNSGGWGRAEKLLEKLPPMAAEEDLVARAWIALWRRAAGPELTDEAARAHIAQLDGLVAQVSGGVRPPPPSWQTASRADEYCRLVHAKQQQLAAAVSQALLDMNKRSDIPFDDRAAQETVLGGIGQFTRGRYAQRIDSVRSDFATARINEGQLDAWLDRRDTDRPIEPENLHRMPGEPLRLLGNSLDRAWENLLDIEAGTSTDTAYWRKQAPSPAQQQRLNRLDAIRQNVIADRKRQSDIRQWRIAGQNKQLAVWLLNEAAALGTEFRKPANAPRRR